MRDTLLILFLLVIVIVIGYYLNKYIQNNKQKEIYTPPAPDTVIDPNIIDPPKAPEPKPVPTSDTEFVSDAVDWASYVVLNLRKNLPSETNNSPEGIFSANPDGSFPWGPQTKVYQSDILNITSITNDPETLKNIRYKSGAEPFSLNDVISDYNTVYLFIKNISNLNRTSIINILNKIKKDKPYGQALIKRAMEKNQLLGWIVLIQALSEKGIKLNVFPSIIKPPATVVNSGMNTQNN